MKKVIIIGAVVVAVIGGYFVSKKGKDAISNVSDKVTNNVVIKEAIKAEETTDENLNLIEDFIKENLNKPIVIKQLQILPIKDASLTILTYSKDSATSELTLKPHIFAEGIDSGFVKISFSHQIKKGSVTSDGKEYKAGYITTKITKATKITKDNIKTIDLNNTNKVDLSAVKIEHFINSNKDIKGITSIKPNGSFKGLSLVSYFFTNKKTSNHKLSFNGLEFKGYKGHFSAKPFDISLNYKNDNTYSGKVSSINISTSKASKTAGIELDSGVIDGKFDNIKSFNDLQTNLAKISFKDISIKYPKFNIKLDSLSINSGTYPDNQGKLGMKFAINALPNKDSMVKAGFPLKLDKLNISYDISHISYEFVNSFAELIKKSKEPTEADKANFSKSFLKNGMKFSQKVDIQSNLFNFIADSYIDLSSKDNNKFFNIDFALNSELDISDEARNLISSFAGMLFPDALPAASLKSAKFNAKYNVDVELSVIEKNIANAMAGKKTAENQKPFNKAQVSVNLDLDTLEGKSSVSLNADIDASNLNQEEFNSIMNAKDKRDIFKIIDMKSSLKLNEKFADLLQLSPMIQKMGSDFIELKNGVFLSDIVLKNSKLTINGNEMPIPGM